MNATPDIRESTLVDLSALQALHRAAFPDEDIVPVVTALLTDTPPVLSLVTLQSDRISGHVIFTPCGAAPSPWSLALLGPLAVAPALRKRGLGTALVQGGLARLRNFGNACVLVLGDPAYYGRFGFTPNASIQPPYALPQEWRTSWQSFTQPGAPTHPGVRHLPQPWMKPALWLP